MFCAGTGYRRALLRRGGVLGCRRVVGRRRREGIYLGGGLGLLGCTRVRKVATDVGRGSLVSSGRGVIGGGTRVCSYSLRLQCICNCSLGRPEPGRRRACGTY